MGIQGQNEEQKELYAMSGKEQWEAETVAKALTKGPERRTVFETTSGIPVERLYTPEDAAGGYEERLGYPGQYPFTRGIQPTMYLSLIHI